MSPTPAPRLPPAPPPAAPHAVAAPRVALLLNCNARSVDAACLAEMRAILGHAHVYASRSLAEAETMAAEVVARNYEVVACGGGDGTFAGALNRVRRAWQALQPRAGQAAGPAAAAKAAAPVPLLPQFAFLPLGTGNALRQVVHAKDAAGHLHQLAAGRRFAARALALIEDERGDTFFFGGMGYDSLLLHDYNRLLRRPQPRWARRATRSLAGYLAAVGRYTLPRLLRGGPPLRVQVTTARPASYFDPRQHDAPVPMPAGTTLYEGPATMLGVATVPYFGYGLRAFPFADAIGPRMQLRVAKLGAAEVLRHLPALWRGSYRDADRLLDFAVDEVTLRLGTPFPFERCGDDAGLVQALRLRVAPYTVQLLDFAAGLGSAGRRC